MSGYDALDVYAVWARRLTVARGRMISASLGYSRKFASLRQRDPELGLFAQMLFVFVVVTADDFGRQEGNAFTVKLRAWPSAPEDEAKFEAALNLLQNAGLVVRYTVDSKCVLQIVGFDDHQQGLHKRTVSRFPDCPGETGSRQESADASRNVREVPPEEKRREAKGNEQKENEQKGAASKPNDAAGDGGPVHSSGSSKRPRFVGTRLTVFPWQHEKLGRVLGKHTAAFDLDHWYQDLDAEVATSECVIPSRDGGAWLEAELLKAAKKRGLTVAKAAADRIGNGGRTGAAPEGKYSKLTQGVK